MSVQTASDFQFDKFLLDPRAGGLFRLNEGGSQVPVVLGSRALAVLCFLVEHRGELVSKQAIMDAVWPDTVVEENNLTVHISTLRRVLDEGRAEESCIQTVTGRGYRFLPLVTTVPRMSSMSDAQLPAGERQPSAPTIAVLPFVNFSHEPRWDRLCDGLVEDIITDLARYRDVLVTARQSSFAYRGQRIDIRAIGRELGARYILEGSVQAEAGSLKITAQLINATSGLHVWAARYARDESGLFAVQDEIVDQVVAALSGFGGVISQAELLAARRKLPASLQAYELYLLGYEQEARLNREGSLRAIELLEAALAADPHMSRAWTVLGWAYGNLADWRWTDDVEGCRRMQREAVLKAAELDPGDGLALALLAQARVREGNIVGAREALERALVVGANQADSLTYLARYVATLLDRPGEAVSLMNRSLVLNPSAPTWYFLLHIRVAYFGRLFELVLDYFVRLQSDAGLAIPMRLPMLYRSMALAQLGRAAELEIAVRELCNLDANLEIISIEAAGLSGAARDVFFDGLSKAHLPVSL